MSTPDQDPHGGDQSSMTAEQRDFPRVSSRCLVDFRQVDDDSRFDVIKNSSQGLLQNISGGGICVRMPENPGDGKLLALTIQLPNLPTSVISLGKVCWTRPADDEWDVGIEFWWVGWEDQSAQEQIRTFISSTLSDDPSSEV